MANGSKESGEWVERTNHKDKVNDESDEKCSEGDKEDCNKCDDPK